MNGPQCPFCYAASADQGVDILDHVRACKPVARHVARRTRHTMFCHCQDCAAARVRIKRSLRRRLMN